MSYKFIKLFTAIALITPAFASHEHGQHQTHESKKTENTIDVSVVSMKKSEKDTNTDAQLVEIKLTNKKDGGPLSPKDLKVVHTEPVHLLIIDSSLKDYSHIHPKPTKTPGVYEFMWYPKLQSNPYRLWADLTPKATGEQEYVFVDLPLAPKADSKLQTIDSTVTLKTTQGDVNATLSFDSTLTKGDSAMGTVQITSKGKPFMDLEPVMGAFAHIVGFYEDFKDIVHIHPMGKEPTKDSMRGGPELMFHITPEQSGTIKLFIQVKINGEDVFFPMTVQANDA